VGNVVRFAGKCSPEEAIKIGGTIEGEFTHVPMEYVQKFNDDPRTCVIVTEFIRPGVKRFAVQLEALLSRDDMPVKPLQLGLYDWAAMNNMPFMVVIIQAVVLPAANVIAQECQMILHQEVLKVGTEAFPIRGSSVYRLQHTDQSDLYRAVARYSNDPEKYAQQIAQLHKQEDILVEDFIAKHTKFNLKSILL
jgi:hypothetical protein